MKKRSKTKFFFFQGLNFVLVMKRKIQDLMVEIEFRKTSSSLRKEEGGRQLMMMMDFWFGELLRRERAVHVL